MPKYIQKNFISFFLPQKKKQTDKTQRRRNRLLQYFFFLLKSNEIAREREREKQANHFQSSSWKRKIIIINKARATTTKSNIKKIEKFFNKIYQSDFVFFKSKRKDFFIHFLSLSFSVCVFILVSDVNFVFFLQRESFLFSIFCWCRYYFVFDKKKSFTFHSFLIQKTKRIEILHIWIITNENSKTFDLTDWLTWNVRILKTFEFSHH